MEWVAWHALHDVTLGLLVRQRDGGQEICAQVDAEDRDCAEGEGDVGKDEEKEGGDLRDVRRESVRDRLLEVVEDEAT